jgi:hypothetical protein
MRAFVKTYTADSRLEQAESSDRSHRPDPLADERLLVVVAMTQAVENPRSARTESRRNPGYVQARPDVQAFSHLAPLSSTLFQLPRSLFHTRVPFALFSCPLSREVGAVAWTWLDVSQFLPGFCGSHGIFAAWT